MFVVEFVLLLVVCIFIFKGDYFFISVIGFFFECEFCLYLVICCYVVVDEKLYYYLDCIELDFYIDLENLVIIIVFLILLYYKSDVIWVEVKDFKGVVDIVVIEVDWKVFFKLMFYSVFFLMYL